MEVEQLEAEAKATAAKHVINMLQRPGQLEKHTNFLIMEWHLMDNFWLLRTSVLIVLCVDMPVEIKPSFVRKENSIGVNLTVMNIVQYPLVEVNSSDQMQEPL